MKIEFGNPIVFRFSIEKESSTNSTKTFRLHFILEDLPNHQSLHTQISKGEGNSKWMQTRENVIKEIRTAVDPYKNKKIHLNVDFTIPNYFKRSIADLLITILSNFKSQSSFTWSSNNNEITHKIEEKIINDFFATLPAPSQKRKPISPRTHRSKKKKPLKEKEKEFKPLTIAIPTPIRPVSSSSFIPLTTIQNPVCSTLFVQKPTLRLPKSIVHDDLKKRRNNEPTEKHKEMQPKYAGYFDNCSGCRDYQAFFSSVSQEKRKGLLKEIAEKLERGLKENEHIHLAPEIQPLQQNSSPLTKFENEIKELIRKSQAQQSQQITFFRLPQEEEKNQRRNQKILIPIAFQVNN